MTKKNFMDNFSDTEDVVGSFVDGIKGRRRKVVLFGTGYCLSLFLDLMGDNGIEVMALCDNDQDKVGRRISGILVRAWDDLRDSSDEFDVVISTSHYEEIEGELRADGYNGMTWHLPREAYYKNSAYGKGFLRKHEHEFQKTIDMLADEASRRVFVNAIKHNISLDNSYYQEIADLEIRGYFGTDLYQNHPNDVIIDGGAFNGDTYREFISDPSREMAEYIAWEPDEHNYRELEKIQDPRLTIIRKGLGEERGTLRFSSGLGVSSSISNEGKEMIEVDSIDNLHLNGKVSFIKMDIEGAERSALMGARGTIRRDHPALAISAYHKKEDMYGLVNLIKGIEDGYEIYFRHTFYYQRVPIQPDVIIYAKHKGGERNGLFGY